MDLRVLLPTRHAPKVSQPASNPKRPRAHCSVNQSEQQACAVYANAREKANPKVGHHRLWVGLVALLVSECQSLGGLGDAFFVVPGGL
ncbi:hypothetical protein EMIT0P253_170044 [Pseudomonas sp. IT-P253]